MGTSLSKWIEDGEDWLMGRILFYAKRQGYAMYASTLEEAWRVSIQGLSNSLIQTLELNPSEYELSPSEDFQDDPVCKFAVEEAAIHRRRGLDLKMFLGLFKYYRQTYIDRLTGGGYDAPGELEAIYWVNRIFDRLEIAFCGAWAELGEDKRVPELQDANRRLTNEKNRFLTVTESLADPVFQLDKDGRLIYANTAAAPLLGRSTGPGSFYYRRDEEVPVPEWLKKFTSEARAVNETLYTERSVPGYDDRVFEVRIRPMLDVSDKFLGWVVILHDTTELRHAEQALQEKATELERLSLTDPLTGLLNRRGVFALGEKSLALARRSGQSFGVLYGDVDNLKTINDQHGHVVGDAVLTSVATAMQSCFRTSDTVARVSGDEFVILLPDRENGIDDAMMERLSESLASELAKVKDDLSASISLGWACFDPECHANFEAVLADADADMYANKRGKNG